jgi:diaminobutyrate-2-oxoglutarate transaminase
VLTFHCAVSQKGKQMFLAEQDTLNEPVDFTAFELFESNVRTYCRDFPAMFSSAKDSIIRCVGGNEYIDFFTGAGALNYGHNCEPLKRKLKHYLETDGITHSLDFYTEAKNKFINAFQKSILKPRNLDYKLQFTGPTGTNAVEAALKLARKVTGRTNVIAFTNAFHGMSLGSLAATTNPKKRQGAGLPLAGITFMPYEGYLGNDIDSIEVIHRMTSKGGGMDAPAAFILETIQGEGGLQSASASWLTRLNTIAQELGALVIVDDIQAGCGRSGRFFSFEGMGIFPDIICLSKSLSGYGLPFSLNLIDPIHDRWEPGEHNGTFRGNNFAFVTACAAIEEFWTDPDFERDLQPKIEYLEARLKKIVKLMQTKLPIAELRGRGFMRGISLGDTTIAQQISKKSFELGLILETCGVDGQVIKFLPALTIELEVLAEGMDLFESAVDEVFQSTQCSFE